MWYCNDCESFFDHTVKIYESPVDESRRWGRLIFGCPHCRSDNYEKAYRCDLCGEYVVEDYVKLKDGTVACNNCFVLY